MKKELILKYINNLEKEDIIKYLDKENLEYTTEEIDLIYNAIKNDYDIIMYRDFDKYISNYKFNINSNLYNNIISKYYQYKKFIE